MSLKPRFSRAARTSGRGVHGGGRLFELGEEEKRLEIAEIFAGEDFLRREIDEELEGGFLLRRQRDDGSFAAKSLAGFESEHFFLGRLVQLRPTEERAGSEFALGCEDLLQAGEFRSR